MSSFSRRRESTVDRLAQGEPSPAAHRFSVRGRIYSLCASTTPFRALAPLTVYQNAGLRPAPRVSTFSKPQVTRRQSCPEWVERPSPRHPFQARFCMHRRADFSSYLLYFRNTILKIGQLLYFHELIQSTFFSPLFSITHPELPAFLTSFLFRRFCQIFHFSLLVIF